MTGYRCPEFWRPRDQPFGANSFADPSKDFYEFTIVTSGQPGDVIAFQMEEGGGSGHMTMKVANGLLIYAGPLDSKVGTYRYNKKGHDKVVMRHYRRK